ncbi:unnamed protein product [Symbiodinium natans]|uniref:Uncharacterized protein n=1 Tax=Symbiodinium natans TaxID=878477 RepID=A0A812S1I1_9DINO|nr:unnamed protein product [Symbiodinium natans]
MLTTKNYSYLAVQLGKIGNRWARRVQQQALHQLSEIANETNGFDAERSKSDGDPWTSGPSRPSSPSSPLPLSRPNMQAMQSSDVVPRRPARSAESLFPNWEIGVQALASVVSLQLRFALRRWETFVRRKRFDELQSKVVLTLQTVSAPSVASPKTSDTAGPSAVTNHRHEPETGRTTGPDVEALAKSESTSPLGRPTFDINVAESSKHAIENPGPEAKTSDQDFVRSLSDDQSRVDEIIKLAALLWESGTLVHVQPMALLRASLLARVAERCQKHVMREAMQCFWKRCSLQRSVEEWLANGNFVKRQDEAVTQMPTSFHTAPHESAEVPLAFGDKDVSEPSESFEPASSDHKPGPVLDGHQVDMDTRKLDLHTVVTQPSDPSAKPKPADFSHEILHPRDKVESPPVHENEQLARDQSEADLLPEVQSGTSGEESEINDDDLADLLG